MIPLDKRPPATGRDELMGLSAWATAHRAEFRAVDPVALSASVGHHLTERLKLSASSLDARDAIGRLCRDDLEAVALAFLFTFRQEADSPDAYAEWQRSPTPGGTAP